VMDYLREFRNNYKPTKKNVVLVPCAADKPYPSPLHRAVKNLLPSDDWYIACVTGVLGIVPEDLWPIMPHYDSGIPNRWRVMQMVKEYFGEFRHDRIVVYSDFYSEAIKAGLDALASRQPLDLDIYLTGPTHRVDYVIPVEFYANYLDLMDPGYLNKLDAAINDV